MDADGIPFAFDIFLGNQNEQTTLKPLETKIIRDFNCSEFIFCSDAGLGSKNNRYLNSFGNRAYVITHSIKKMKNEYKKSHSLPHNSKNQAPTNSLIYARLTKPMIPFLIRFSIKKYQF